MKAKFISAWGQFFLPPHQLCLKKINLYLFVCVLPTAHRPYFLTLNLILFFVHHFLPYMLHNKLIRKEKNLGYRVVDHIEVAHLKEIKIIRDERGIDEIILCEPTITDDEQEKLIDYCAINNIIYRYIPTTLQSSKIEISFLDGEPLIEVKNTPLEGWGRILKRIFDMIVSVIGIIITAGMVIITEYYTSKNYRPVKAIAEASKS